MKIASIYDFKAFPPKGGNHVHALRRALHASRKRKCIDAEEALCRPS